MPNIEVSITEIVRRVEVTIQEVGGGAHSVVVAGTTHSLPWSSVTGKPSNLCTATLSEDEVSIEFYDLAGNLITKAPFLP